MLRTVPVFIFAFFLAGVYILWLFIIAIFLGGL